MPDTGTDQVVEQQELPNFFAIKLGVTDFDQTAAFYAQVFGMSIGPVWDKVKIERALQWREPGHGPVIIMFNETVVAAEGPSEGGSQDPVLASIVAREHPFRAGSSWLCLQVEDIEAVAKELAALGKPSAIRDVGELGFRMRIIMTTDPDDNVLEITQPY
ncbi:MAG TPA: VOC family protein [Acidimicrobiia bacterium]|nr:VOC family protein [Acidimicrobiia bacterium]